MICLSFCQGLLHSGLGVHAHHMFFYGCSRNCPTDWVDCPLGSSLISPAGGQQELDCNPASHCAASIFEYHIPFHHVSPRSMWHRTIYRTIQNTKSVLQLAKQWKQGVDLTPANSTWSLSSSLGSWNNRIHDRVSSVRMLPSNHWLAQKSKFAVVLEEFVLLAMICTSSECFVQALSSN